MATISHGNRKTTTSSQYRAHTANKTDKPWMQSSRRGPDLVTSLTTGDPSIWNSIRKARVPPKYVYSLFLGDNTYLHLEDSYRVFRNMFVSPHPQSGRGDAILVRLIVIRYCWDCIARFLKYYLARHARNGRIDRLLDRYFYPGQPS